MHAYCSSNHWMLRQPDQVSKTNTAPAAINTHTYLDMSVLTRKVHRGLALCVLYGICQDGKTQSRTYVCMYVCTTDVHTVLWKINVLTAASGEAPWSKNDAMSATLPLQANQWSWGKTTETAISSPDLTDPRQKCYTTNDNIVSEKNWHDSSTLWHKTCILLAKRSPMLRTYVHKFSDLLSNSSFTQGHNEPPPRQLMKAHLSNECNAQV